MQWFLQRLIDVPARLIGELIATCWPILGLGAACGLGYLAYSLLLPRVHHRIALGLALAAALYAALVIYKAEKWTAFALLHHYDD